MPLFTGDAYKLIRKIPDGKIHCVVTSPPYWGLRNYGNDAQIGLEPSPELFVRKFVLLFREIRRTLRKDGTIWLNMGDSYYGSGKGYGHNWENSPKQKTNEGSLFSQDMRPPSLNKHPYLKSKDLIGIPWRIAFALQEDGWYLRSDIVWAKTNSMPESVLDRPTRSHEYVFLLSKSPDYYFNHKAIQEDCVSNERDKARMKNPEERPKDKKYQSIVDPKLAGTGSKIGKFNSVGNGEKRNKRDVWSLATSQFKGSAEIVEYRAVRRDEAQDDTLYIASPSCLIYGGLFDLLATALCDEREVDDVIHRLDIGSRLSQEPRSGFVHIDQLRAWSFGGRSLDLILSECSAFAKFRNNGSRKTGLFVSTSLSCKPFSERLSCIGRILEKHGLSERKLNNLLNNTLESDFYEDQMKEILSSNFGKHISVKTSGVFYKKTIRNANHFATMPEKLVEPCILAGCPRGGIVLDPFAGAATVGVVAERLGRKFIGFELNPEYAKIAEKRLQDEREKGLLGAKKRPREEAVQTSGREAAVGIEDAVEGIANQRDFDAHL
jgi:DNA modification methylase